MSPDRFYGFKIYQNAFTAGAVPRTPPGNLTVLPQISQLHLRLFEGRDGTAESGVYHYIKSQHIKQYHTVTNEP